MRQFLIFVCWTSFSRVSLWIFFSIRLKIREEYNPKGAKLTKQFKSKEAIDSVISWSSLAAKTESTASQIRWPASKLPRGSRGGKGKRGRISFSLLVSPYPERTCSHATTDSRIFCLNKARVRLSYSYIFFFLYLISIAEFLKRSTKEICRHLSEKEQKGRLFCTR